MHFHDRKLVGGLFFFLVSTPQSVREPFLLSPTPHAMKEIQIVFSPTLRPVREIPSESLFRIFSFSHTQSYQRDPNSTPHPIRERPIFLPNATPHIIRIFGVAFLVTFFCSHLLGGGERKVGARKGENSFQKEKARMKTDTDRQTDNKSTIAYIIKESRDFET